jgi:hypothetical protein
MLLRQRVKDIGYAVIPAPLLRQGWILFTGGLTTLRRLAKGPSSLSAASGYTTQCSLLLGLSAEQLV